MPHASFFKHDMNSRVDVARDKAAAVAAEWKKVCAAVDLRDGKSCRCCDKRSDPEATGTLRRGHRHHLVYRSAGGKDLSVNLVTLCAQCHSDEHHNKLRIKGDPDVALTFWRKEHDAPVWYIVREEIAVRQVRKD